MGLREITRRPQVGDGEVAAPHPEGCEDAIGDEPLPRGPTESFDENARHDIHEVAILEELAETGAGLEIAKSTKGCLAIGRRKEGKEVIPWQPGSMAQQIAWRRV
jgi:hypothetical protein